MVHVEVYRGLAIGRLQARSFVEASPGQFDPVGSLDLDTGTFDRQLDSFLLRNLFINVEVALGAERWLLVVTRLHQLCSQAGLPIMRGRP